jgi:hypothetical protein
MGDVRECPPMTAEQIANFRKALVGILGPYALMMPDADVVKMRDNFQRKLDTEYGEETRHD